MGRDLEGLEGKVFPLVGAAVPDAPLLRGYPRNAPFRGRGRIGFADGLKTGGEASGARRRV
jgi:hypothetical protein